MMAEQTADVDDVSSALLVCMPNWPATVLVPLQAVWAVWTWWAMRVTRQSVRECTSSIVQRVLAWRVLP
jgi:hypothetical protein